jgi:murein hydrolase activator
LAPTRKKLPSRFRPIMNGPIKHFVLVLLTGVLLVPLSGQSLEDLRKEQSQLTEKLSLASKLLAENQLKKEDNVLKLSLLSRQIETRKQLIRSIEKQVVSLRTKQTASEEEIRKLRQQKENLMDSYAGLIQASYRSKLLKTRWLFLFSAHSLSQLYQRWRYLKLLSDGVQKQLGALSQMVDKIDHELAILHQTEAEKQKALREQEQQKKTLDGDVTKHKSALASLGREEKQLRADIEENKKAQARLRAAIVKIISESRGEGKDIPLTPALARLSSTFAANKGSLPWPVDRGLVVRAFGKQVHPTLKNVTINNNGIDITTEAGSSVKAVFEGIVVGHQYIPGYDHMVIISHGDYYTVYSYLSSVLISRGDKIRTGDPIGVARERGGSGQIHLEIWKGRELLNPQSWLKNH